MEKIPSLLERDFTTGAKSAPVTGHIQPGTEWVFTDAGVIARRKWNGTSVLLAYVGGQLHPYVRRMVHPGATSPAGFLLAETDENTGRAFGWEPAEQSGYAKAVAQALERAPGWLSGTYELVGPKVHNNAERLLAHMLVRHDIAEHLPRWLWWRPDVDADINLQLAAYYIRTARAALGWEGVVFYHPDGRRAKLKARDVGEYLDLVEASRDRQRRKYLR